jgi:hypothetical protein
MTRDERKSIAEKLHAIQATIDAAQGQLDSLLDQVVNEPQPKAPAKISQKKTKAK